MININDKTIFKYFDLELNCKITYELLSNILY